MLRNKFSTLCLMNFSRSNLAYATQFCSQSNAITGIANLRESLEKEIQEVQQRQQQARLRSHKTSIYRVPTKLRVIQPTAYEPQFISIGPYHRALPRLKALEVLKWDTLSRIVSSRGRPSKDALDRLLFSLSDMEPKARECYSDDAELSKDEFVKMMLLDGCFIVELFRELKRNNFESSSLLPKRWMLPAIRRDLIILENQLPMMVLKKIFEETMEPKSKSILTEESSLEDLALRFFAPLMPRNEQLLQQSITSTTSSSNNFHHLLDVFHSSITYGTKMRRGNEPHMYRPLSELKKAGIKVRILEHIHPLETRFERGVLRMPGFVMDNNTGCFLKNIIAYEQCHEECKPDVTSYLFFLDKLVNSPEDVALLNYEGVIQHSLGNNNEVSKLITDICKQVEHDGKDSYLYEVIDNLNSYSGSRLVLLKSRLKEDYFGNMWLSISTLAALLLLYLTLLQASCDAIDAKKKGSHEMQGWWARLHLFLLDPVEGLKDLKASGLRYFERVTEASPDDDPCLDG